MPVICVMPTTHSVVCTSPICLAYTQDTDEHAGHYDCVVPLDDEGRAGTVKPVRCTCGRRPQSIESACSSLRCPCVRVKRECVSLCVCKKCSNTLSVRPSTSTTRHRQSYDNQRHHPLRGTPTAEFMKKVGESSCDGHLTNFESLPLNWSLHVQK